jgi:uncharacterized protein
LSATVELPAAAAWRHLDARDGFEVVFPRGEASGYRFEGQSTAVEEGVAWSVGYEIVLDAGWTTRSAHVLGRSKHGDAEVRLERDAAGGWRVDGRPAPHLDGCEDVDLEASACTNAFPVHRLALAVGERADAPAVYVRAPALQVERLEQTYARLDDDRGRLRYDYACSRFDYRGELLYDELGLVLDYPGIAVRIM